MYIVCVYMHCTSNWLCCSVFSDFRQATPVDMRWWWSISISRCRTFMQDKQAVSESWYCILHLLLWQCNSTVPACLSIWDEMAILMPYCFTEKYHWSHNHISRLGMRMWVKKHHRCHIKINARSNLWKVFHQIGKVWHQHLYTDN